MRAVIFTLDEPDGPHIADRMFGVDSEFEREQIYHLNVLADETVILLGRLRGDLNEARRLLDAHTDVLGYSISSKGPQSSLVYVHAQPPPAMKQFLELPRLNEVFFDFPIGGTADGRLRVEMLGETNGELQEALADVPPELDVTIERIGPYPDGEGDILSLLTDRQREVLEAALSLGYYDVPREATHSDIAQRLDCSVGTVGEHLQKIESRVFKHIGG